MGPPSTNDAGMTWGVGLGADTRPVYGAGQTAGDVPANCSATYVNGKWACEHRRTATANMVAFRQATAGQPVVHWQNVGGATTDHIAFGLGNKGFVAINRTASSAVTTYQTGLPAGNYCDIVHYDYNSTTGDCLVPATAIHAPAVDLIVVNASGQIANQTLNAMDALAIYSGAGPLAVTLADFHAEQVDDFVRVTWETASELDNSGFNLYRGTSAAGPEVQLNQTLIASQSPGSANGFIYILDDHLDLAPGTDYYYWLETVEFSGATEMYGPVSLSYVGPTAVTLASLQATPADPLVMPVLGGLAVLAALAGATVSKRRRCAAQRFEQVALHEPPFGVRMRSTATGYIA